MSICFFSTDCHAVMDALGTDSIVEKTTKNNHLYHEATLKDGRCVLAFNISSRLWLPFFQSIVQEFSPETVVLCKTVDFANFFTGDILVGRQVWDGARLISEKEDAKFAYAFQKHACPILTNRVLSQNIISDLQGNKDGLLGNVLRQRFAMVSDQKYAQALLSLRTEGRLKTCGTSRKLFAVENTYKETGQDDKISLPLNDPSPSLHFVRISENPQYPLEIRDESAMHLRCAARNCRLIYCVANVKDEDEKECGPQLVQTAARIAYCIIEQSN